MKKLFSLLLLIITLNVSGQKIIHNQPVTMKVVPIGIPSDSLVTINGLGEIRHRPLTDIQISPNVAIIAKNEGNGLTYFPQGQDRSFKGVGGAGALDMSFADGLGVNSPFNGALGSQSLVMGYNMTATGYAAFALGEDGDSSGTYSFNQGYGNTTPGYATFTQGAFNNITSNYAVGIGHSIDMTVGGGNIAFGIALSQTSASVDKTIFLGTANIEPSTYAGGNNLIMVVGNGTIIGGGSTKYVRDVPSDALRVWKDGRLSMPSFALGDYSTIYDITTVEKVTDMIASGGFTKLAFGDTESDGTYSWEVDGRTFIHNYTNSANKIMGWTTNTFIGVRSGNYTSGGADFLGSLNVGVGAWALNALTTGIQNNMVGNEAGAQITTGMANNGMGDGVLYSLTTGDYNTAIGKNALQNIVSANENLALGHNAGFFFGAAGGTDELLTGSNHVLIGYRTRPSANGTTNEIVLGHDALGKGSNTAVIGSSLITKISAGADYTATADEDLVTKGHLDGVVLGTLSNIVEDLTPQLGGHLDAQSYSIEMGIGNGSIGTARFGQTIANTSYIWFNADEIVQRSHDNSTGANYGQIETVYNDFSGLSMTFNDVFNGTEGKINFLGIADVFQFSGIDAVSFDYATIQQVNLTVSDETVATTITSTDVGGATMFSSSATAVTFTIPDTLTVGAGASFSVIVDGAGALTVTTTGTATINGSTTFDVVVAGATGNKVNGVTFIQKVASSDDWFCVGAY